MEDTHAYIQIHRYKDMGIDRKIQSQKRLDVANTLNLTSAKINALVKEPWIKRCAAARPPGFPTQFLSKNWEYHQFQNQGIFRTKL